jgi:hypothetical protein
MAMTLTGFVFDSSGNAVSGATVQGYVSADNATTTAESATTTDSNGKWSITTSTAARIPMDVKITFGDSVRWLKAGDSINVSKLTLTDTLTVGEDDVGFDVTFHGASAGAAMIYDASEDTLEIRGPSADASTSTGKLLLTTALTDVNANDVLGDITFKAPLEAGGTDAITAAASITAVAQGTFAADLNATDLVFSTGSSGAATEKFRFTSDGELGVGGTNYGSSGDVLTSGGAGSAPSWQTPTTGDITGITAGDGLSGTTTSGNASLAVDLGTNSGLEFSSNKLQIAKGISQHDVAQFTSGVADDDFLRVDGTVIEGRSASEVLSDIGGQATLTFGISNTNAVKIDSASVADDEYARFTANGLESRSTSEVLSDISAAPAAGDGNILTVGALDSGSITSGFTSIDVGSGAITTTGTVSGGIVDVAQEAHLDSSPADETVSGITATFTAGEALVRGEVVYFKASDSKMHKAVATASGTMPAVAMAAADISADATGKFLLYGFIADNGTFPSYTVGAKVYAPEGETSSQNVPEETAPDSDGDFVQVVGYAVTANSLFFNPSNDVIEHA